MRLIDADDLLKREIYFADMDFNNPKYDDTLRDIINRAPTIDAVPVVLCKDCKWFRDSNGIDGFCYCDRIYRRCGTHWFCANGERRDQDGDSC